MSGKLKRPASGPETAKLRRVWVNFVGDRVWFKFADGAGVGVSRADPNYHRVVGEWFTREVDAPPTVNHCEHGTIEDDYCEACNAEYKRARKENGDDDDGPYQI